MSRSLPSHALVLTAGLGTRLRPLSDVRAKPAIPVAGEPIVRRIIAWLAANGVADLVLNLHHRPDTLTAVVGDGSDLAVRVRYSWEQPVVLGSAGGPRQALPIIGAETFLLVNGDTLTDLDLRPLADAHAAARALVTLALVPNRDPRRYGGVRLDHEGRVIGFAGTHQSFCSAFSDFTFRAQSRVGRVLLLRNHMLDVQTQGRTVAVRKTPDNSAGTF